MIIFINGSINAGKSTVARGLAKKLEKPALVEIDSISEFTGWMSIDEAVPINLENAVSVICNFAKHGFNIIVPYPLSEKNYRYVMNGLQHLNENIFVFTLAPQIKKPLTSTADRSISEWETTRIKHHYDIGIPNPSFGTIIDNTDQTPEETVEAIYLLVTQHPSFNRYSATRG